MCKSAIAQARTAAFEWSAEFYDLGGFEFGGAGCLEEAGGSGVSGVGAWGMISRAVEQGVLGGISILVERHPA